MEESLPDLTNFTLSDVSQMDTIAEITITDTSPTELQNTLKGSLETDKSAIGAKGGGTRSVKEFEDQLTSLKKENFNLKLRIYFLEEKLGVNFTLDEDNALKKNIELKVEIANLQKELQEKHDLLCQAVKAMELEDEDHKKNIQAKDEQLNMCQQEIEELRSQIHLMYEKENNASLQILLDQTESVRQKLQASEKECLEKTEIITNLRSDMESLSKQVKELSDSKEELKQQLSQSNQDNQSLLKKMEEESGMREELIGQLNELKRKYSALKLDIEREHKKSERAKMFSELRVNELENENEKYKAKVRDLTGKLEIALNESKKHHNLAVPSCQVQNTQTSNIDDSFSDTIAATDHRTPKKDALSLPLKSPLSSPTSDKFDVSQLEMLLLDTGNIELAHQILSNINTLKAEHSNQAQRIKRYKAEQLKACEIIKSMIDNRNKTTLEIKMYKKRCEELESKLGLTAEESFKSANETLNETMVPAAAAKTEVLNKVYITYN